MYSRNDFKLRFSNFERPKFFINKKKGTVVCKLVTILETPRSFDSAVQIGEQYFESVGVAKCSSDDVFDEVRGKKIALAKAENDAYTQAYNYLNTYLKELEFFVKNINNFTKKAVGCKVHNNDYIKSLHDLNHEMYRAEVNDIPNAATIYVK